MFEVEAGADEKFAWPNNDNNSQIITVLRAVISDMFKIVQQLQVSELEHSKQMCHSSIYFLSIVLMLCMVNCTYAMLIMMILNAIDQ